MIGHLLGLGTTAFEGLLAYFQHKHTHTHTHTRRTKLSTHGHVCNITILRKQLNLIAKIIHHNLRPAQATNVSKHT